MGKLLFNTSAPANLTRSFVSRVVRRGKPIDITGQLSPEARVLASAESVPASARKILPQVLVRLADETETMLALVDHTTHKIISTDQTNIDRLRPLDKLPETVRPQVYAVVDRFDGIQPAGVGPQDTPIQLIDAAQRKRLMGDASYLVLGENSVVIGRYDSGEEAKLVEDYRRAFHLVS